MILPKYIFCFTPFLLLVSLLSPPSAKAFSLALSAGTLSTFEKNLGQGLYSQSELWHNFRKQKNVFLLGAGYFYSSSLFVPSLYFSWQNENWSLYLGNTRTAYRHGFLSANGAYSDFEKNPYFPFSPWEGTLAFTSKIFYFRFVYQQTYQQNFFVQSQKQFFTIGGFRFWHDIFDIYGGYLWDIRGDIKGNTDNRDEKFFSENRNKKQHSFILGFDIGNHIANKKNKYFSNKNFVAGYGTNDAINVETSAKETSFKKGYQVNDNKNDKIFWLLSLQTNRLQDVHSFVSLRGKVWGAVLGYYQKHTDENFAYAFFRDQKQAVYWRLHLYYLRASAKLNNNYQRLQARIKIPLKKIQRDFIVYGSYSSKSSPFSGLFMQPPQNKVGVYGGFYWLPPFHGCQASIGLGQEKLFALEYTFVWLRQEIYAAVNPLFYYKSGDELRQEGVPYVNESSHIFTLSAEKNGFSFLLRFVFSDFQKEDETVFNKNIFLKLYYTHHFAFVESKIKQARDKQQPMSKRF